MAGHIHSLLEANNIDCHLRNMHLTGGIGELPLNECWPEVWVNDETDFTAAEQLIKTALSHPKQEESWLCQCGESIEGQFEICWFCGNEKKSDCHNM